MSISASGIAPQANSSDHVLQSVEYQTPPEVSNSTLDSSRLSALQNHILSYIRNVAKIEGWFGQFRRTTAARFKISVRHLARVLKRLRDLGLIPKAKRRGQTSALYVFVPEPARPAQLLLFSDVLSDVPSQSLLSEHKPESPSGVESTVVLPKTPPDKPSVQNQPRPIPQRVWGVVQKAWGRIKQAKNPEAYRQSIINSELRLEKKREMEIAERQRKQVAKEKAQQEQRANTTWERRIGECWTWPPEELDEHGIPWTFRKENPVPLI